jgi:hypothetical protein
MRKPYAQALDTVSRLQEGVRSGLPVLVPGAREAHAAERIDVIADPAEASARADAVLDRIRREPDRVPKESFLARVWRRVYRGPDALPVAVVKKTAR